MALLLLRRYRSHVDLGLERVAEAVTPADVSNLFNEFFVDRITGEDCFYLKVYLRSIDELSDLLDRFLVYGETTTSLINASPIPRRDPPLEEQV